MGPRVFLLSPARLDGQRGQLLFQPSTMFPMARAIRAEGGAEIGEVFEFVSGLYFRGKRAYAHAFARPPRGVPGALVITQNRGLIPSTTRITLDELDALRGTAIDPADPTFHRPLARDVAALADAIGPQGEVVLLGSIASAKYVDVLLAALGDRLLFPSAFVGRGDMSRGGLMLRAVDAGSELEYQRVLGAVRHGTRPPKLTPRR